MTLLAQGRRVLALVLLGLVLVLVGTGTWLSYR